MGLSMLRPFKVRTMRCLGLKSCVRLARGMPRGGRELLCEGKLRQGVEEVDSPGGA